MADMKCIRIKRRDCLNGQPRFFVPVGFNFDKGNEMSKQAIKQELPGPCPQGYYHFDLDGVPVYVDGSSNALYSESGEALMHIDGKLCVAWKVAEGIMRVEGRSESMEECKIHFKVKQDDFLVLLEGAS